MARGVQGLKGPTALKAWGVVWGYGECGHVKSSKKLTKMSNWRNWSANLTRVNVVGCDNSTTDGADVEVMSC